MSYTGDFDKNSEQNRIDSIQAKFLHEDLEEDELKYQTALKHCQKSNTTFWDGEYEVLGDNVLKRGKKKFNLKLVQPNFQNWELWNTCPYRVYQNGLGNCGLIASLAAISIHEGLIESLFRDFKINDYGVYQVKLCVDGEWENFIIDDWMPSTKKNLKGVMSKSEFGQNLVGWLWAALIEKAIAKLYNGYANLEFFNSTTALRTTTGAPVKPFQINDFRGKTNQLWEMLMKSSIKNYPMVCSCWSQKELHLKYGWEAKGPSHKSRHVFTIMSVILYKSHRLLKVRNPWGRNIWTGKWTDDTNTKILDSKDTKNRAYGNVAGSFWIGFDEFLKYFYHFDICRYRPSWDELRVNMAIGGLEDGSQKVIEINVPKDCDICVSALKPSYQKLQYHTWISIHRVNSRNPCVPEEIMFCEPIYESSEDISLPPGDYMIYVSNFFESFKKDERNVVIHSSIPISAKLKSWSPEVLVDVYQRIVAEKGKETLEQRERDVSIKKYLGDNFVMVMADNYTDDKYLHVHTFCSKVKTSWLSRGDVYNHNYGDVIPPRSRQILITMCRNEYSMQKGFPMAIDYYLSDENVTVLGMLNRAAHIPSLRPTDYIHQIAKID
ncbi:hypothetical protein CRE_20455 [Caenorhabditis remanei]|uniref:Calpain catalytic domain-containing protein n=1 Tax=Caenorhabditis remanei TaxID=31234 RepID=E3N2T4_CAERE|nr:hypothetical protein CRE_20455 [Caenorhabditis remanei]